MNWLLFLVFITRQQHQQYKQVRPWNTGSRQYGTWPRWNLSKCNSTWSKRSSRLPLLLLRTCCTSF